MSTYASVPGTADGRCYNCNRHVDLHHLERESTEEEPLPPLLCPEPDELVAAPKEQQHFVSHEVATLEAEHHDGTTTERDAAQADLGNYGNETQQAQPEYEVGESVPASGPTSDHPYGKPFEEHAVDTIAADDTDHEHGGT